jgi:maltoporin
MIARSRVHWSRPLTWFAGCIVLTLFGAVTATGQQTGQLEEQLQQLKQQYDATTHDLEQRIAALEQQIKEEKDAKGKQGTVSAVELAARETEKSMVGQSNQVGANFQGQLSSEPTYDLLREADVKISKLQEQLGTFEFHGYFRSGYGLNSVGGEQVAFQSPGADAKYRLGNEAETYARIDFCEQLGEPGPRFR